MINRKSPILAILRIEKMSSHRLAIRCRFIIRRFWQDSAEVFRLRGRAIVVRMGTQNVVIVGAVVILIAFVSILVFDTALFRHVSLIFGIFAADEGQIRQAEIIGILVEAILSSWPNPDVLFDR